MSRGRWTNSENRQSWPKGCLPLRILHVEIFGLPEPTGKIFKRRFASESRTSQKIYSRTVGLFRDFARFALIVTKCLSQWVWWNRIDFPEKTTPWEKFNLKAKHTYKHHSLESSAAITIAPQPSHSLVVQADCKKVIEEKEKHMQRLQFWTDAVEALVRDKKLTFACRLHYFRSKRRQNRFGRFELKWIARQ